MACTEKERAAFPRNCSTVLKGSTEECIAYSKMKRSTLSLGTDIFPDENLYTHTIEMGFFFFLFAYQKNRLWKYNSIINPQSEEKHTIDIKLAKVL